MHSGSKNDEILLKRWERLNAVWQHGLSGAGIPATISALHLKEGRTMKVSATWEHS